MHCKYYAFQNELTSTGFGKNSGSNFLEIFDIEMPGTQFIYTYVGYKGRLSQGLEFNLCIPWHTL